MPGPFDVSSLYLGIGERVTAARKRLGLSQSQLAKRVELSRGSIANIERGHQHAPVETLFRIGRALDVEPRDLLPSNGDLESQSVSILPPKVRRLVKDLGLAGTEAESYLSRTLGKLTPPKEESP